jgi:tetracycline 7-halogenase / FADH2 O2-dependent halogenase
MPHTVGFVDALFSTGIAYSLAGIERIVEMLSANRDFGQPLYDRLKEYEQIVSAELKLIDLLVAGCYKTMGHFPLFNAWSMLYFTFTIAYEQKRLKNLPVNYFLEASNTAILQVAYTTYDELLALMKGPVSEKAMQHFTNTVRERIAPFNTVGLLNPASRNIYQHTVAEL